MPSGTRHRLVALGVLVAAATVVAACGGGSPAADQAGGGTGNDAGDGPAVGVGADADVDTEVDTGDEAGEEAAVDADGGSGEPEEGRIDEIPDGGIPDGMAWLLPAGPYEDGQRVRLLASDTVAIDPYNSSPRLCASVTVDGRVGEETCDPSWLPPAVLTRSPPGTVGVTVELPRSHFGPTGRSDCGDEAVRCRLLWLTEDRTVLHSVDLAFTGPQAPMPVTVEAEVGDDAGSVTVRVSGIDPAATPAELFTEEQLRRIERDVSFMADFDPERLEVEWRVSGLCGFGPGTPTVGSEGLVDPPSWWPVLDPDASDTAVAEGAAEGAAVAEGAAGPAGQDADDVGAVSEERARQVAHWFAGTTCDLMSMAGGPPAVGDQPLELALRREIHGFGGWLDCAIATCYLEVHLTWYYPMPDGSTLGSSMTRSRVIVDVPESWPASRPSIRVVEPGPYRSGRTVTVEVSDHPAGDGLGIGWCPGGDGYCTYRFSTLRDGVHRVVWTIPPRSEDCGPDRCYFQIDSRGEGLPPPAIVIVPIVG